MISPVSVVERFGGRSDVHGQVASHGGRFIRGKRQVGAPDGKPDPEFMIPVL